MSWNKVYATREQFDADSPSSGFGTEEAEAAEQVDAARTAAQAILDSGAIGDANRPVSIVLSGHANPGHVPRDGFANDTITVNVTQLSA
jgi:hypothetical protein